MNKKQWLFAAILTFITICAWVVFDIIHKRAEVEISPKLQDVIEPLNPEFDTSAFKTNE